MSIEVTSVTKGRLFTREVHFCDECPAMAHRGYGMGPTCCIDSSLNFYNDGPAGPEPPVDTAVEIHPRCPLPFKNY